MSSTTDTDPSIAVTSTTSTLIGTGNFLPPVSHVTNPSFPGPAVATRTQFEQTSTSTIIAVQASTTSSSTTAPPSSRISSPPAPTAAPQYTNGVPTGAFYGFAAGIVVLLLLGGGFFYYRWSRSRRRTALALEAAAAGRVGGTQPGSFYPYPPNNIALGIPLSSARSWTSSEWDARSNKTPRRAIEPSAMRPDPERTALHNSNMARLDALREGRVNREAATRRAHFLALEARDELERETMEGTGESTIKSDDTTMDLERRGPAVNEGFRRLRERRWMEGGAWADDDVSTDAGFGEGGLIGARDEPPRGAGKQAMASRVPKRAKVFNRIEVNDPAFVAQPEESDRLSQVDMTWTESDTMTRDSTVISDDPWRDEAHENQRRARTLS